MKMKIEYGEVDANYQHKDVRELKDMQKKKIGEKVKEMERERKQEENKEITIIMSKMMKYNNNNKKEYLG